MACKYVGKCGDQKSYPNNACYPPDCFEVEETTEVGQSGLAAGYVPISFEKWWDGVSDTVNTYEKDLAKNAWEAAIINAEKIIAERYDEQEPWLEPGEITKILCGA